MVLFYEMSSRLARCVALSDPNAGKVRLYLSKAAEFKDELAAIDLLAPSLSDQFHNASCTFWTEKLRHEIASGSSDLMAQHVLDDAIAEIKPEYLPHVQRPDGACMFSPRR